MSRIMSPSLYRNWSQCNRKSLLDSNRFLGNIHTVYGRAFEEGAKELITLIVRYRKEPLPEPLELEDEAAYVVGIAFMKASKYLTAYSIRDQHKEKNYVTLIKGLTATYQWLLTFLQGNTIEQYEERIIYSDPMFDIGGAYDLRAKLGGQDKSCIYDFKGITSFWRYAFPTDPQVPIYTVLKQMQLLESGSSHVMGLNSGYIVNLTSAKLKDEALQYIPIDTQFMLNNLTGIMTDFINAAKQYKRLQVATGDNLLRYYLQAGVTTTQCSQGNYDCFYKSECSTLRFEQKTFPDNRIFDSRHVSKFSVSLLNAAIDAIRKNTSNINMVDGSTGIISGDQLSDGDIDALFADKSLWI